MSDGNENNSAPNVNIEHVEAIEGCVIQATQHLMMIQVENNPRFIPQRVSRHKVRAALKQLKQIGLVELRKAFQ